MQCLKSSVVMVLPTFAEAVQYDEAINGDLYFAKYFGQLEAGSFLVKAVAVPVTVPIPVFAWFVGACLLCLIGVKRLKIIERVKLIFLFVMNVFALLQINQLK